ncbi:putative type I restriction enzymeP M protein [termite gut metagenome]|uniref:Putative type I restriction enzymeP M protein n=1 Tax=termite gut metagenome TaxID=433724 RepID=A0A5J4P957_9ZZZZ
MASDPKLASLYFLSALEKIPKLIEKYQADTEKIAGDLPVLREVETGAWRKENELKDLKSELSALDRKIQLSLKPIEQGEDKQKEMQENKISVSNEHYNQGAEDSASHSYPMPDRLREMKEGLGSRLIIASANNQPKGFKL